MSKPVGPYSPIVAAGPFLFTSGQIGLQDGALVDGDVTDQFKQALVNLRSVLESLEANVSDVVKTTIFVTNMADFAQVNEIYADFFGDHRPARSTVEAAALPLGALIEIEAIAHKG